MVFSFMRIHIVEWQLPFGNFSEHLAFLIDQAGAIAREAALASGITPAVLSRYLSGQRQPRFQEVEILEYYFRSKPDYLLNPRSSKTRRD